MKNITLDGVYTGSQQHDPWNRLCSFHYSWNCGECGGQNEEMIKATNNLNDTEINEMYDVSIMEDNYKQYVLTLNKGIYCLYCSLGWDIKDIKLNFPNTNARNSCLKNKKNDMRFMFETMYDY